MLYLYYRILGEHIIFWKKLIETKEKQDMINYQINSGICTFPFHFLLLNKHIHSSCIMAIWIRIDILYEITEAGKI